MHFNVRGLAALSFVLAATASQAAVIDFGNGPGSPSICSSSSAGTGPMQSCASWTFINQSYGDTDGLDVSYRHGNGVIHPNSTLRWWGNGYNDLFGVLFADGGDGPGSHAVVELKAVGGSSVSLEGFDLGSYSRVSRGTIVDVYDMGTGESLFHFAGTIGSTHKSFDMDLTSTAGLRIEFKNTAYNVGIDNIQYTVTTAVPEPETVAMMLAGLAAVGALARRRKA